MNKFLCLLQSEIEKVSLFALKRVGELSDTIGSLRFGEECVMGNAGDGDANKTEHKGRRMGVNSGRVSPNSTSEEEAGERSSDDEYDDDYLSDGSPGSVTRDEKATGALHHLYYAREENEYRVGRGSTHSSAGFVANHNSRLMFADRILGEDSILVSAVDEVDAFCEVGTEVLHLLKFICVNAMACRKILKKHDKLLRNRMLGSYYQRRNANKGGGTRGRIR